MTTQGHLRARARTIRGLMRFFDHRTLDLPVQVVRRLDRRAEDIEREERSRAKRGFAKIIQTTRGGRP
jgi:hypothetical protein